MIDVQDGESSFASKLSKASASAHSVAYLKSILKLYMQLDKINYICYSDNRERLGYFYYL